MYLRRKIWDRCELMRACLELDLAVQLELENKIRLSHITRDDIMNKICRN